MLTIGPRHVGTIHPQLFNYENNELYTDNIVGFYLLLFFTKSSLHIYNIYIYNDNNVCAKSSIDE